LKNNKEKKEIRSVISYLKQNIRQGDVLYVYYGAIPAFDYYKSILGFHLDYYIEGIRVRDQPINWEGEFNKLRGSKRVWLLFSHILKGKINGINEEKYFIHHLLKSGGKILYQFSIGSGVHKAGVYLFDLSDQVTTSDTNA
jgi:hypothetical protein